jgi:hypothetical protein
VTRDLCIPLAAGLLDGALTEPSNPRIRRTPGLLAGWPAWLPAPAGLVLAAGGEWCDLCRDADPGASSHQVLPSPLPHKRFTVDDPETAGGLT